MVDLIEIRIDGRGGQGNVVAAYLLAEAAFEAGFFVQAFPTFGPERRGAPVAAFVRLSKSPIRRRCQVREPSYVIIQDPSLLRSPAITEALRSRAAILVNSHGDVRKLGFPADGAKVLAFPGSALAAKILGVPIANVALLAAFLALTALVPLAALERALARRFRGDALDRNLHLVREAAARVAAGSWKGDGRAAGN